MQTVHIGWLLTDHLSHGEQRPTWQLDGINIYTIIEGNVHASNVSLAIHTHENVSSQLSLQFNTKRCKCVAFGKMAKSAMSGDGLQSDHGAVMWCDTTEYLAIHFRCGKRLQVDTYPIRKHFYTASNSILMNASHQDQLIQLHLQECYCLSLLTYCHGALNLSKAQLSEMNACWNNFSIFISGNHLFVSLLMDMADLIFCIFLNWSLLRFSNT